MMNKHQNLPQNPAFRYFNICMELENMYNSQYRKYNNACFMYK